MVEFITLLGLMVAEAYLSNEFECNTRNHGRHEHYKFR